MKNLIFREEDGYKIFSFAAECGVDIAATKQVADPLIESMPEYREYLNAVGELGKQPSDENIAGLGTEYQKIIEDFEETKKDLYQKNLVFLNHGPNALCVSDEEAATMEDKNAGIGKDELLAVTGEVIPNYKGKKYWGKQSGRWTEVEITMLGITPPAGAVLSDELNPEQQKEISGQQNTDRIAGLSSGEKAAERERLVKNALSEAARLKLEADIEAEVSGATSDFSAAAYYAGEKSRIEALYA